MKVKISREARILMGLMFAAAAVLVWINFFTQQRQGFGLFGNQSPLSSSPSVSSSPSAEYIAPDAVSSALPDASTLTPDVLVSPDATSTDGASGVTAIDPTALGVDSTGVDSLGIDSLSVDTAASSASDVTAIDPTAIDPTAIATEASTEVTPVGCYPSVDASVIPSGDVASSTDVAEVASTELTPEVTQQLPDAQFSRCRGYSRSNSRH